MQRILPKWRLWPCGPCSLVSRRHCYERSRPAPNFDIRLRDSLLHYPFVAPLSRHVHLPSCRVEETPDPPLQVQETLAMTEVEFTGLPSDDRPSALNLRDQKDMDESQTFGRNSERRDDGGQQMQTVAVEDETEFLGPGSYQTMVSLFVGIACAGTIIALVSFSSVLSLLEGIGGGTKVLLSTAAYGGMFVGGPIGGRGADIVGRKVALMVALGWIVVCQTALGLQVTPSGGTPLYLSICQFLLGLGAGTVMPIASTFVSEIAPSSGRGYYMSIMSATWFSGSVLVAVVAWLILGVGHLPWHIFTWISAMPAMFAVMLVAIFVPETPRFLFSKGRLEECTAVLCDMGTWNGIDSRLRQPNVFLAPPGTTNVPGQYDDDGDGGGGDGTMMGPKCIRRLRSVSGLSGSTPLLPQASPAGSVQWQSSLGNDGDQPSQQFHYPLQQQQYGGIFRAPSLSSIRPMSAIGAPVRQESFQRVYSVGPSSDPGSDAEGGTGGGVGVGDEESQVPGSPSARTLRMSTSQMQWGGDGWTKFPRTHITGRNNPCGGVFDPSVRRQFIAFVFVWFSLTFVTYSILVWAPKLFEQGNFSIDPYVAGVIVALVQLAGGIAFVFLIKVDRLGRRKLLLGSGITGCVLAFILLISFGVLGSAIGALLGVGVIMAILPGAWVSVQLWTNESFPTSVRGLVLGMLAVAGRLGAIAGQLSFSLLMKDHPVWVLMEFLAILVVLTTASAFLKSTDEGFTITDFVGEERQP